jgi:hypothetical protein
MDVCASFEWEGPRLADANDPANDGRHVRPRVSCILTWVEVGRLAGVHAARHRSCRHPAGMLAVLGYVLGTYAGLLCMAILKAIAGA